MVASVLEAPAASLFCSEEGAVRQVQTLVAFCQIARWNSPQDCNGSFPLYFEYGDSVFF